MLKGPKGEKRPTDGIGAAVKVMQIATGEIEETTDYVESLTGVPEGYLNSCVVQFTPRTISP